MEKLSDRKSVIILRPCYGSALHEWIKIYDQRVMAKLAGERVELRQPLIIAMDYDRAAKQWVVYKHADNDLQDGGAAIFQNIRYVPLWSEMQFARKGEGTIVRHADSGCCLASVLRILRRDMPPDHVHTEQCEDLFSFIFEEGGAALDAILVPDNFTVVLGSHLRSTMHPVRARQKSVDLNWFATLGVFGAGFHPPDNPDGTRKKLSKDFRALVNSGRAVALSVTHDLDFMRLDPETSQKVSHFQGESHYTCAETLPAPADQIGHPLPPLDELTGQPMDLTDERFVGLELKKEEAVEVEDASCDCRACRSSNNLEHNLPKSAKQKLYKNEMGLLDLLKFGGLHSQHLEDTILECSRMSVASFDVESLCEVLDGVVGQEHLAGPSPPTLSDFPLTRQVLGIQKAVLIGYVMSRCKIELYLFSSESFNHSFHFFNRYTDYLLHRDGFDVDIFEKKADDPVANDEAGNEIGLEWNFLSYCVSRRDAIIKEKCRSLKPLLETVEAFRHKFFTFFQQKKCLPKSYKYVPNAYFLLARKEAGVVVEDVAESEEEEDHGRREDCLPEPSTSQKSYERGKRKTPRPTWTGTSARAKRSETLKKYNDRLWERASSSDEKVRENARAIIDRKRERARLQRQEKYKRGYPNSPTKRTAESMSAYKRMIDRCDEDHLMLEKHEKEASKAAAAKKKKSDDGLIRRVRDSWKGSLFGLIEKHLESLIKSYLVFGFNSEAYDLVVLCARLVTAAKAQGLRGIRMSSTGSRIRFLTIQGIRFTEARRLAPPGCNLSRLAKFAGLEEEKSIFPFNLFTS